MSELARARTPDDEIDDQMEANISSWMAARGITPRPPMPQAARITRQVEDNRYISVEKAAAEVGKSKRTIYSWIDRGLVDYRRDASGCIRVRAGSLWLDETLRAEPEP